MINSIFMKSWMKMYLPEFLLLIVIPIVTIGFNTFQSTSIYQNFIGTTGIARAIDYKLLGLDFSSTTQQHMLLPSDPEFKNIWRLIKNNTPITLPMGTPAFIGIESPHAHDYVELPGDGASSTLQQIYLIPDSVPVVVGFCDLTESFNSTGCKQGQNAFIIGTVQDLKDWLQSTKDQARTAFDSYIGVISAALGIIVIISERKNRD